MHRQVSAICSLLPVFIVVFVIIYTYSLISPLYPSLPHISRSHYATAGITQKYIEGNEKEVRKLIAEYLTTNRVEKWQTLDLVDKIAHTYKVQHAAMSQSLISRAYTAELDNYRTNHGAELSRSARKLSEVFGKLTQLEREVAVSALHSTASSMPVKSMPDHSIDALRRIAPAAHTRYLSLGAREKVICYFAYNSIIALPENTKHYTNCDDQEFSAFKNETIMDRMATESNVMFAQLQLDDVNRYLDSLKLIPLASSSYDSQIYRIYSRRLEEHAFKQREVNNWRNMTEADTIAQFYAPIFSIIFEKTPYNIDLANPRITRAKRRLRCVSPMIAGQY
ncbi:predicted protein [Lichtheimia corymbifera JMRC:FSU:9682]|uniref:Uncharacterized protein n=1 Tax=Lichtheimia corymbifera JMRC:FSU:9682 TaxID=1263082 RepID=A0A068RR17_9FUNG|nr:predicted protein [Lichtheimia corymbifera JMRC:FSU:9682]